MIISVLPGHSAKWGCSLIFAEVMFNFASILVPQNVNDFDADSCVKYITEESASLTSTPWLELLVVLSSSSYRLATKNRKLLHR